MRESLRFFSTCPKGMESLLYEELSHLGCSKPKQTLAGVHFSGSLQTAYRICLWSRIANRVLMPLCSFRARTTDDLYEAVLSRVNWHEHMETTGSFAVDFAGGDPKLFHTHYSALRIKDAIVDQFNAHFGDRPSVDTKRPDIRINVYLRRRTATLSLDLSGESLHKRGYRIESGAAPLKENLAAAVLVRAGWPHIALDNGPLVDPMCGSGTLLIEAAMMAFDRAPGLGREYFGFLNWKQHNKSDWKMLLMEAEARAEKGIKNAGILLLGFDKDEKSIKQARSNAARSGVLQFIQFDCRDIDALKAPQTAVPGLVVANPPYGERMGQRKELERLYRLLGDRLKLGFSGWQASIFTANPELAKNMGIRAKKQYRLFNGPLSCRLLNFEIHKSWAMRKPSTKRTFSDQRDVKGSGPGAAMFANRLRKNLKNIGKWARRNGITCYRLYDADMPEYAVAVDIYHSWAHVQEYQAPSGVDPEKARHRLNQIRTVLPEVLGLRPERIVLKTRERKRGKEQYQKLGSSDRFFEVQEGGLRFLVNLQDYLDTGLFLDQRITRQKIRETVKGKRFLNLFCYTGTATVYAVAGGARQTTSVDMSHSYLSWAEKNLMLNKAGHDRHQLVQADCLEWVKQCHEQYDLIFMDPPTFSNSRGMKDSFDIQRDHARLLRHALRLLAPGGLMIFSSNRRKFKLDRKALEGWDIRDITRETIPRDFERNKKIHHCYEIKKTVQAGAQN